MDFRDTAGLWDKMYVMYFVPLTCMDCLCSGILSTTYLHTSHSCNTHNYSCVCVDVKYSTGIPLIHDGPSVYFQNSILERSCYSSWQVFFFTSLGSELKRNLLLHPKVKCIDCSIFQLFWG